MEGAMGTAHEARQATQGQSQERATAMDKMITDALARNTAEITAKFMALLNGRVTASMPTSLKVTSGAAGISTMPPFD